MALIVGLTGVDGAGKSAAARAAVERLEAAGGRVLYHHELEMVFFRPLYHAIMRPFGRRSAAAARDRFVGAARRPGLASDAYFLLLWLDSLVAYLVFRARRGVVVHDRWLYDQFALMDRIGYSRRAVRWLYDHFPRPDRLILLSVSPSVAMARKASDPGHAGDRIGFFEAGAERIRLLAQRHGADLVVDADTPLDEVVTRVVEAIEAWKRGPTGSARAGGRS